MVAAARARALFVSDLQPSQHPSVPAVKAAVQSTIRRLRTVGCVCEVAREFGDHPDTAAARMCWCVATVQQIWGGAR